MRKKVTILLFVMIASIGLAGCGKYFPGKYTYRVVNENVKELSLHDKAEYEERNKKEFYKKSEDRLLSIELLLQENAKKDKIIRCLLIGQFGLAVVLILNEIAEVVFKGTDGEGEKK